MCTATVTSEGQITIPSNVRSDLRLDPGDRVEFVKVAGGHWELLAVTEDIKRLQGMIISARSVSTEEMNSAIRDRAGKE